MIEELLPYYEKQLQEFAQQARGFAQRYPKIAQRLSLNQEQIDDPHIERLIQAFSLISARIDKKLEDSYDFFTHALFEVMFPQYLKHFPSCTVVSFEDINQQKKLSTVHIIPAKSTLKSRSINGVQCTFSSCSEVRLLPIRLLDLAFNTKPSTYLHLKHNATLAMTFEVFAPQYHDLSVEILPIYLDAISSFPLQVLDEIFKKDTRFSLKIGEYHLDINNPFEVLGFEEKDSLLPLDQHSHHAYRLLTEYFCFPERFHYLYLKLDFLKKIKSLPEKFELEIHIKLDLNDQAIMRNYSQLNIANFKLFTTPIINLFEKHAEPQKIDHRQTQYSLITDAHRPEYYQLYSVLKMNIIREKNQQERESFQVYPFFAMSHYHGDAVKFFYSLSPVSYAHKAGLINYSIISKALKPDAITADFISTQLLCSNSDLPHKAIKHAFCYLSLNDRHLVQRALVLKRPTMTFQFKQNKKEQWRIISHLSLNTLALMKGDGISHLKELLELYNLPQSRENHLMIDSIRAIQLSLCNKLIDTQPFPLCVRGLNLYLYIDSTVFRGHSLYMFSQLISHVFNLKVQMNSFVDVIVFDAINQQELYRCTKNMGGKKLL